MGKLKLASIVLGENYNVLKLSSVKAQQKVINQFGILLIPALLWGLGGFGVAYSLMGYGWFAGVVTGVIACCIILQVDLAFMQLSVSENSVGWIQRLKADPISFLKPTASMYRLLIVIIGCVINSLLVDSILFEQDYLQMANRMHLDQITQTAQAQSAPIAEQLIKLKQDEVRLTADVALARKAFVEEMDGSAGSGQRGLKTIALAKKQVFDDLSVQLNQVQGSIHQKESELMAIQSAGVTQAGQPGLFTKLEALVHHTFFAGKTLMMVIYIIFFVFIVMLEFSPIFIKSNMDATDYDLWKVNDELAKRRTMEMEAARVKRMQDRMDKYTAADWQVIEKMKAA